MANWKKLSNTNSGNKQTFTALSGFYLRLPRDTLLLDEKNFIPCTIQAFDPISYRNLMRV